MFGGRCSAVAGATGVRAREAVTVGLRGLASVLEFRGDIELQWLRPGSSACGGARAEGMPDSVGCVSVWSRCSRMRWMTAGSWMQAMTVEHRTCLWLLDLFSQPGCAGSKRSKPGTPRTAMGRQRPSSVARATPQLTSAYRSKAVVEQRSVMC